MTRFFAVHSADIATASKYYQDVFGLSVEEDTGKEILMNADPFTMCVTQGDTNRIALEFAVDDLDAAEKYLLEQGCEIILRRDDGRPRYFQDRYGMIFHLWKHP